MIVIIDYNVGNLKSVLGAFSRIGVDAVVSRDKEMIRKADAIVLPGVGTFPVAMENLKKYDLIDILNERKNAGIPILGICLGMQILFEKGYEVKKTAGLGFIPGTVEYMDIDEKVPHMGWNQLHFAKKHPILKYVQENDDVYFVHSYMAHCLDEQLIAYTDYGNNKVTALVSNNNVIGCQFHPEKSGTVGKQILLAFKEMIKCY
ncbi:imidazole glycerol phosphate synthase subunit HisH [[Clostridium] spiroforme]|nr:imidazole glycerol phosphate synthase subunit HisH [Thomasclavelia spiroformis]MBM6881028.1 imidazole glycerol phosphate synthase subunit HisH [Thomasclavelia spiroformis]